MARLLTPTEQLTIEAVHGSSIQQILDSNIPIELKNYTMVFINGQMITDYEITVRMSDSVLLAVVPQGGGGGGKNILGAVLSIAVMVAAVVLAAPTGGASLWLAGATGLSAATAGLIIGAGVSMIGMMAVSALIPPPAVNTGDVGGGGSTESPTYSLSGQSNQARKYSPVTRVYGTHKVFPNIAANPLIRNMGLDSSIAAIYDFGLGDIDVVDLKIGDADFHSFSPEFVWHKNSLAPATNYVTRKIGYDQFSYVLKQGVPVVIKTKPNTVSFDVDLTFPKGLAFYQNNGDKTPWGIDVIAEYRQEGSSTWNIIPAHHFMGCATGSPGHWDKRPGSVHISATTAKPLVVVAYANDLPSATYEIRVMKLSQDETGQRHIADVSLTLIKSYANGTVVNLQKPHTMLEMRVQATDKLSGVIQNLSGIATSVLRYTTNNGASFATKPTNNPAWIAIDILTGTGNPKPLPDNQVDWASWQRLAEFCDRKGFTANFVVDYSTTVQELLNSLLSSCRASLMITSSGRYGCLIDEERTIPRQLITPANSWGFSGTRTFIDPPHAFRVGFINPDLNWQRDERTVFFDGYHEGNATKFETLDTFGITDKDEAWRYGRYMMAQGIHRSETFTCTLDVENLVCQRGDLVHVANDVVRVGGMPCRVVSVSGSDVTVNTELSTPATGYSVRLSDGTTRTGSITKTVGASVFTLDNAAGIDYGDLMVLGIMDRVVQPYIIQAIVPGSDLTAELTMVKYVPEVYTADTGAIPPWNPGFGNDMINKTELKITNLTAKQEIFYVNRMPFNKVTLNWTIEGFSPGESDIYYSIDGGRQILLGSTGSVTEQMIIDLLKQPEFIDKPVEFEVIPHSVSGVQGTSAKVTITPAADRTAPLKVDGFSVNVQDMLIEMFWEQSKDLDIDFYEIRYSPDVLSGSWNSSQRIGIVAHNVTKTSAGARTGKYFIQATDTSGNKSEIAWQRTTIETLPHVNQIQIVNDQPNKWNGTLSGMNKNPAGNVESGGNWGSVNPIGYYYFKDLVKFDDIYEVRVSNKTLTHGQHQDDIVAKWIPTVASVRPALARATASSWNSNLQVRTSDGATVMKDWLPLNTAKPLEMSNSTWTDWRNITVSDVTARQIQFRIKAESFDPLVRVVLVDGQVEIDANDWVWKKSDESIPASGKLITYDVPFMFRPVLAITIDGTTTAVKYEQTNANRHGFNLKLLDAANNPVAGKVDIAALGNGKQRLKSI